MSYMMCRTEEGDNIPVFVCDGCRQQIDKSIQGNSIWLEDPKVSHADRSPHYFTIFHTHKHCNAAFCRDNAVEGGRMWMTEELALTLYTTIWMGIDHDEEHGKYLFDLDMGKSI